jgi:hypothetical protein
VPKLKLPDPAELQKLRPEVSALTQRYLALANSTERCDREEAEEAIANLYLFLDRSRPTMVWFESPLRACAAAILWDLAQTFWELDEHVEFDSPIMWYRLKCLMCLDIHQVVTNRSVFDDADWDSRNQFERLIWQSFNVPVAISSTGHTAVTVSNTLIESTRDSMWWMNVAELFGSQLAESSRSKFDSFVSLLINLPELERSTILMDAVQAEFEVRRRSRFNEAELARAFLAEVMACLGHQPTPLAERLIGLARHCWWWRAEADVCFLIERPTEVFLDRDSRVHREDGYAIRYADDLRIYCLKDISVSEDVAYGRFNVHDIDRETNAEVRRSMIDRFGVERYLQESGAEVIHQDEFGVLYRRTPSIGEPMLVVKVVNSTQEPDGSRKEYFLRVPPSMLTARQAVAWTFSMGEFEYGPRVET